jgi:DNA-binding CsgD family transcriptional regulator
VDEPSPTASVDEIIAAIHEGVFEQPLWERFLTKIRRCAGADYASLTLRRADAPDRDVHIMKSGGGVSEIPPQYGGEALRRMRLPYDSIAVNRPYTLGEIVDLSDERHLDYIDYLKSRGICCALIVRVVEPHGGVGWLTLGGAQRDFPPGTAALLARLAPHLSIAARTLAALEREHVRAEIASDAVHRLNFGWLTFDARARVIEIDAQAERLLARAPGLAGCAAGQTFPLGGAGLSALREALSGFAQNDCLRPRAIHLVDRPWLDMLVAPVRYRAIAGGPAPIAVGYVHAAGEASPERCDQLVQLFGLTNSEARLALALSQGRSIAEAAEALNLTVETARNYSKKIYAKTDARGQADLVRIILASVLALT